MKPYGWAVDGFGRQFIVRNDNDREIIMCCMPHSAQLYVAILEDQDAGRSTDWAIFVDEK